jgi:DNA-binding PadR family transcriptional regulator
MSEARVLVLVARYPHPVALARRAGSSLYAGLQRLEACGLVTTRQGSYRLTGRGCRELELQRALARVVARSL